MYNDQSLRYCGIYIVHSNLEGNPTSSDVSLICSVASSFSSVDEDSSFFTFRLHTEFEMLLQPDKNELSATSNWLAISLMSSPALLVAIASTSVDSLYISYAMVIEPNTTVIPPDKTLPDVRSKIFETYKST